MTSPDCNTALQVKRLLQLVIEMPIETRMFCIFAGQQKTPRVSGVLVIMGNYGECFRGRVALAGCRHAQTHHIDHTASLMAGFLDDLFGGALARATAGSNAKLAAEISHTAGAGRDGPFDLFFGHTVTQTNVHIHPEIGLYGVF